MNIGCFDTGKIVVPLGKSASGKTVLTDSLVRVLPNVGVIPSTTTRAPRPDDLPGEYEYVPYEDFHVALSRGEFVSWRKFSKDPARTDDLYSVRLKWIQEAMRSDKFFVRSLTPDTAQRWHDVAGHRITFIYLVSPDEKEARRRMAVRGGMTQAQIDERIQEEKGWDKEIAELIRGGIPIHIIPQLSPEEILIKTLGIIGV